jgi:hypothetical protein
MWSSLFLSHPWLIYIGNGYRLGMHGTPFHHRQRETVENGAIQIAQRGLSERSSACYDAT